MSGEIKLEGFEGLGISLDLLPLDVQKHLLGGAMREACRPIVDDARQRAPVHAGPYEGPSKSQKRPGTLRDGIKVRISGAKIALGIVTARIGPSKEAFYKRWVEFGHAIVPRRGGNAARGSLSKARRAAKVSGRHVPAHPFLRPAIDSRGMEAVSRLGALLGDRIDAFMKQRARGPA